MGASEAETRAEAAAVKVAAGLGRLQGSDGVEGTRLIEEANASDGESKGAGKEDGGGVEL